MTPQEFFDWCLAEHRNAERRADYCERTGRDADFSFHRGQSEAFKAAAVKTHSNNRSSVERGMEELTPAEEIIEATQDVILSAMVEVDSK